MTNPLSGLKLEHWWHAFTVLGGCGMVASLAIRSDCIAQRDAFLFFLAMFLFGVGQWINHPIQQRFIPGGIITGYRRHATFTGVSLEFVGGVIFLIAIVRIAFVR